MQRQVKFCFLVMPVRVSDRVDELSKLVAAPAPPNPPKVNEKPSFISVD
jgi:hypothetical protein